MNITSKKEGDVNVLAIDGRLDTTNYSDLEHHLSSLTEKNEYRILMNLEKMQYISSSGLRIFLMFLKKVKAAGGRFMLCGMSDDIREIFEISGFINIFEIFKTEEEALNT